MHITWLQNPGRSWERPTQEQARSRPFSRPRYSECMAVNVGAYLLTTLINAPAFHSRYIHRSELSTLSAHRCIAARHVTSSSYRGGWNAPSVHCLHRHDVDRWVRGISEGFLTVIRKEIIYATPILPELRKNYVILITRGLGLISCY